MKKVTEITYLLAGFFLCALAMGCLFFSSHKLTYLEYRMSEDLRTVSVSQSGQDVEAISCTDENGKTCYEILESLTLNVLPGRPVPDTAVLCDMSGRVLCGIDANVTSDASDIPENVTSDTSDLSANITSNASDTPENEDSGSPGYTDPEVVSVINFHIPFLKRPAHPEKCCIVIRNADGEVMNYSDIAAYTWFGGSREFFWTGFCIFGIAFSLIYIFRILYLMARKRDVCSDSWVIAMALTAVTFAVMCVLASEYVTTVMDENDNIIGGMLQTGNNTVMYRDYISQHMPAVYWLCALYSLLGAKAVGQFRLLFILTVSIVWGLVFLRHRKSRYVRAISLFAICSGPLAYLLIVNNAGQILSDNVQAVSMTILLLEMMAYYEDHKLGPGRCLVVSACVFASVGSAFISVYAVFACMAAVIAEEIRYHLKNPNKVSYFIGRYALLFICVLLPWAGAVAYLAVNGALKDAFDMAFRFNVEVYPKYGLPGANPIEPLYSGVLNIASLLRDTMTRAAAGEIVVPRVVECCMIILACILLAAEIFRRGLVQAAGLFFFIETQATRQAVQFHSIMLWYVVFMFILAELPGMVPYRIAGSEPESITGAAKLRLIFSRVMPAVYTIVILAVTGLPYAHLSWDVLRYRVAPVPATEMQAVNDTEEGEEIFVEGGILETDYVFYKRRYPVSRLCWTLPWYYEWYGEETVQAVRENKTRVVIYKLNPNVWGVQDFATEMDALMLKDYTKTGELDLFERTEKY